METTEKAKRGKVVFVEPRGVHANVFARFMNIPMLGPLYLGTIARQAGYDVTILNENILARNVLAEELADADILCVSCMTATIRWGNTIAKQYKDLRTQMGLASRTIIGGIHASMIPEDVTDHFDQVFVGEAETKILDVLSGRITDKVVYGERLEDLDSTPIPDFHLLKDYHKMDKKPIMTSRGCPYDCTFCSVTEMFGRGYRTKSVARVMEEIRAYNSKRLFFVDDHFVVNKRRTEAILEGIQALDYKIVWSCQLRTEVSKDRDLVAGMRSAGCSMVYIGFESINPEALKQVHKGQSVEDIKRSIQIFKQNRIGVHGMFMFGMDADRP
ncbi:B12-binding domain-containing radical SAM protein, partial [Planctomycetota bacterium]